MPLCDFKNTAAQKIRGDSLRELGCQFVGPSGAREDRPAASEDTDRSAAP
jgi:hypothetical protein